MDKATVNDKMTVLQPKCRSLKMAKSESGPGELTPRS